MSKINVAILGSGFIVDVFTKNIKQFKNVHLRGIWGRHLEKLKQFDGFDYYTCDINDILEDEKVDVVYVALPNSLHYEYTLKCLQHNKHVMLEKPFTVTYKQAKHLSDIARKNKLFLYETMSTYHTPNYLKIKEELKNIGDIKIVEANISSYSSRYDKFKQGIILPVLDYKLDGGALMDMGVYNIALITGLFGEPKKVKYDANIKKKVDTSGIVTLDYGKFKAVSINAKDSNGACCINIQGDNGYIYTDASSATITTIQVNIRNKKAKTYSIEKGDFASWKYIYNDFFNIYNKKDYETCYKYLDQTLLEQKVLEKAYNSK